MNPTALYNLARVKKQRGAQLIEFVMMMPIILTVVFGIVGFSLLFMIQHTLDSAVTQGARVVAVAGSTGDAEAAARQLLSSSLPSALYPNGFTFQGPTITAASNCAASLGSGSNPTLACMQFEGFFTPANNTFLANIPFASLILPNQLKASAVVLYQTSDSL